MSKNGKRRMTDVTLRGVEPDDYMLAARIAREFAAKYPHEGRRSESVAYAIGEQADHLSFRAYRTAGGVVMVYATKEDLK
jgi:hypothetical protein